VLSVVDKGLEPGEVLVQRQFTGERLVCVRTARVVGHDEAGLRIWIPSGSPGLDWRAVDGRGIREMPFAEWIRTPQTLAPRAWSGPDILMFFPTGAAHSVWWFWRGDGTFDCWYVNLEEPGVWWRDSDAAGIDVCDQDLDIVASPDRTWRWKDEDEFAERLGFPDDYWVPDEAAVWAEGRRVAALIEKGAFPFDGTWCDWRPDPAWTRPPAVPGGWDRPRAW
jgi:hypothetical protein